MVRLPAMKSELPATRRGTAMASGQRTRRTTRESCLRSNEELKGIQRVEEARGQRKGPIGVSRRTKGRVSGKLLSLPIPT